jgi:hypothetical protein
MQYYILLKAALLTEGIRSDSESLKEIGTKYKEQKHGILKTTLTLNFLTIFAFQTEPLYNSA